jgi:tRNA (adenine57-N1/adenine58-N1)-methyltransferase
MAFSEGEPALLVDDKGRKFLLRLDPARTFQYHLGSVAHAEIIGKDDGTWIQSSAGGDLLLLRPRLADFILKMKRGPQVVYPKDIGPILVYADIGPGMTVLEAGSGSGALTLALARAVGDSGRIVSVEIREDHAAHASKTVTKWFGDVPPNVDLRIGDVADVFEEVRPDRVVLDLPDPSAALAAASRHQPTGGILAAYLPTVPQVQQIVEQAREIGGFAEIEVKEFMFRDWNVKGRSVRPEHRMIGHTGFLVFMRRIAFIDSRSPSGAELD